MASAQSLQFEPDGLDRMERAYAKHLRAHLSGGAVRAWVIEAEGQIVASGAVSILPWPPGPAGGSDRGALLHSMYTAPAYRRRGLARRIVEAAIDFCRAEAVAWLMLGGTGSEAGKPLYESVGFRPSSFMRLDLRRPA